MTDPLRDALENVERIARQLDRLFCGALNQWRPDGRSLRDCLDEVEVARAAPQHPKAAGR